MLYARGTFQLNSTTYTDADRGNFTLKEYAVIDTHVVVVTDNSDASVFSHKLDNVGTVLNRGI